MSRKLPEELAPVLAQLGHAWPLADEDALRQAATVWREFGAEAERLGRRGGASAGRVTGENSGRSVDAFAEHWRTFSGGGRGHVDDAQHAAELVAKAFETAAQAADTCKAELVSALTALAEELKKAQEQAAAAKADAAKAAASATTAQQTQGVFGAVAQTVGAVAAKVKAAAADTVAAAERTVAVEAAGLKVAGLLEELGRAMRAAMQTALKEPSVTALERLSAGSAAASGPGAGVRTLSEVMSAKGGFDAKAAGLPAVLGEAGVLGKDGAGLKLVVDSAGRPVLGEDGKPVLGVEGLTVKLGADGKPELDDRGNPVILHADGTKVADTSGLKLLPGEDGKPVVGVEGLTVKLDRDGKPLEDENGRSILDGADGRPVVKADLTADVPGKGKPPHGTVLDALPGETGPGGRPGGLGGPGGLGVDVTVAGGAGPDGGAGGPGTVGAPGLGVTAGPGGPGVQLQTGPVGGSGGGGGWDPAGDAPAARPERPAPASYASSSGGGGGRPSGGYGPVYASVDSYLPGPAEAPAASQAPPSHGAGVPASVRTDSVYTPPAISTDQPAGSGGGHGWGGGTSGGSVSGGVSGGGGSNGAVSGGVVSGGGSGGGGYGSGGSFGGATGGGSGGMTGGVTGGAGHLPSGGGQAYGGAQGIPTAGPAGAAGTPGAAAVVGVPATGGPAAGGAAAGGAAAGAPVAGGPVAGGSAAGGSAAGASGAGGSRPGAGAMATGPVGVAPVLTPGPGRFAAEGSGAAPGAGVGMGAGEPRRRPDHVAGEGTGSWATPVATGQVMVMAIALRDRRGHGGEGPEGAVRPRSIADGRPYGVPGGLGPVDPQHQAEVERRVPRGADGLPVRHPDPAAGGWAEVIDDGGYREPGRANNGLEIALSAVDTFAGRPACSAPRIPTEGDAGERGGRDRAERELGAPFRDLGDGAGTYERLAGELRRAGHGSQAVLLTVDAYGRPHAWNAVNHQDAVTYLDHQTGRQGPAPLHSADHGLWAIALDPDGRPLDLAERRPRPAVQAAPAAPAAEDTAGPGTPAATDTPSTRSADA